MTGIKFEEEKEPRPRLPKSMLIYSTHIYNPFIPKVVLTEHNHFLLSIAENTGLSLAGSKIFCCWAEKEPYSLPRLYFSSYSFIETTL